MPSETTAKSGGRRSWDRISRVDAKGRDALSTVPQTIKIGHRKKARQGAKHTGDAPSIVWSDGSRGGAHGNPVLLL